VKYQHVMFKLQDAEAAWELYNQTRHKLAQLQAALALGEYGPKGDELAHALLAQDELTKRLHAYEVLVLQRAGGADLEESSYRMQEVGVRLTQIQERRTEHMRLKTELEAELSMGAVAPADRAQAEAVLENQKRRMEVLCQQAESSLPMERLIIL